MKSKIWYWFQLVLAPVYLMSLIFPRKASVWAFGSTFGRRFADNPRYFFLYLAAHSETGIRPVWISHDKDIVSFLCKKGYEAYYYLSLRGIIMSLRAGAYIFDNYTKDINFWTGGGALKVNLWHGTGNKKINHDNLHDRVRHPRNLMERFLTFPRRISDEKPSHYVLTTSDDMMPLFSSAFKTPPEHMIIDGYPRNDMLFEEGRKALPSVVTGPEKDIIYDIEDRRSSGYRIIMYFPTFRKSETGFFDVMDLKRFDEFLVSNKYYFVCKLHPKSALKERFDKIRCSNITVVDADVCIYNFLHMADLLVTDYSSVYSDYMLLDRPVVAFQYDRKEYENNSRDYSIDQDEYMPERKASTDFELMAQIRAAFEEDICREARDVSRKRMFKYMDGRACERLAKKISALCGLREQSSSVK